MHCCQLFYDTNVRATTAVLATFSTAVFGYGIVGLLRPLTVYPSEMVYWLVCHNSENIDRAELNQRFRIYLPFPSFKVYKSTYCRIKTIDIRHQDFTLTRLRTTNE